MSFKMPSLMTTTTIAVAALALAARPTNSFLAPTNVPPSSSSHPRCGSHGSSRATTAATANRFHFRSRGLPTGGKVASDSSRRSRTNSSSSSALMMAKKKGGGAKKKSGGAGASGKKKGKGPAAGQGFASGTAVAEAPPAGSVGQGAGSASPVEAAKAAAAAGAAIQNRASDAAPVSASGGKKTNSAAGGSKGFGPPPPASPPQPKPLQKGLNKAPQPMNMNAAKASSGGAAGRGVGSGAPPSGRQPGAGMDPLAPGLPVAENTDHQKVVTDVDFSEPELNAAPMVGSQAKEGEMSPADMLKYLRDNNLTIDLETMNPVEMPRDPAAKMEAMFPYPPANVKGQHYLGPSPKPSEFVSALLALLPKDEPWNGKMIRPLPDLKDFLLANRLHGGSKALNVITALMFQAMSEGDLERAKPLKGAAICTTKAENTITGPLRQAVMFAENRMAPCMGSTACEEYAGSDGADAAATWIVLKACVAEWELRLREFRGEELGLHDIFRTMPNPTEGLDEERTAAITGSVQAMGRSFSENERLMTSLPLELRFMEGALGLNTTTEVRKFALQNFCPQEGVSPEELRFRLSSLLCGLEQLPPKSYHQLQVAAADVYLCLVEGAPEEYNIYYDNWDTNGKEDLTFQTYRLDTGEKWRNRLREIVTAPTPQREDNDDYERLFKEILPKPLWDWAASDDSDREVLPFVMLEKGWWGALDFLDEDKLEDMRARDAEVEAAKIRDPALSEGQPEVEMNDIFSDYMAEERAALEEFNFDEAGMLEEAGDEEILDGPGPGMEELDLGF